MLVVVFGTTGELIKLAPVLRRLQDRGLEYLSISTNQQVTQIPVNQHDLRLRPTDIELAHGHNGHDLENMTDIPSWLLDVTRGFQRQRSAIKRRLARSSGQHVVMVHGDPMTTVLGAVLGRTLRLPVAHLEAGMRSHNLRNPFPEELDRRIAGRLARIHYANTDVEVDNLRGARGDVVRIGANTVLDAIALVPSDRDAVIESLGDLAPRGGFGICSIHRTELLENRQRLAQFLEVVDRNKPDLPILFIDHPVTVSALRRHGLDHKMGSFVRIPRQRYIPFIGLLRECEFLLTDSGGCQEECYYLDIPCLVHRLVTERSEGVGTNVVMTCYELAAVSGFLRDPQRYRTGTRPRFASPSDVVVEDLISRGVWE
jgi:UDP-N-acetylglucosamine 2-epimerase (non-hydrolysing)